jgi:hypothetical protein
MKDWSFAERMVGVPKWAFVRAGEITGQIVPQVHPEDTRNMLYEMPAGLSLRLTLDIAHALVKAREETA